MAITNYGKGNWFGLPEFGITEKFFKGDTGSVGNAAFRTAASKLPRTTSPVYQSKSATPTNVNTSMSSPTSSLLPKTTVGDEPTLKTSEEISEQDLLAQEYGFDTYDEYLKQVNDVGDVYKESSNYLNTLESRIKGGEQDFYNIFTSPYSSQIPLVQSNAQAGISNLENQRGLAQYQEQDAMSAARNLYNELSNRNRQAFGGVSSVGQAASEIGAREMQKQMGTIRNQAAQTVQGIVTKINEVQANADAMVQQLTQQKESALSQAKLAFQDKLSEIDGMRNTINQQKAQLKLDALKEFRDRVQYLQDVQTQRTYELENMKSQAIQQLQAQATEQQSFTNMQNQYAQQDVGQQGEVNNLGFQSMFNNNQLGQSNVNSQSLLNGQYAFSPNRREEEPNIFGGGGSW